MCFVSLDPQRGNCRDEGSIQVSPGSPAHFLFLFFSLEISLFVNCPTEFKGLICLLSFDNHTLSSAL